MTFEEFRRCLEITESSLENKTASIGRFLCPITRKPKWVVELRVSGVTSPPCHGYDLENCFDRAVAFVEKKLEAKSVAAHDELEDFRAKKA